MQQLHLLVAALLAALACASGSPLQAARGRLNSYFDARGLDVSDVPKAVLVHEMLGMVVLLSTWTTAYYFPPSRIPALAGPLKRIEAMIPVGIRQSTSNNKILTSRLGGSYIEASCFRKLIRPATIPLKLAATFSIVQSELLWKLKAKAKAKAKTGASSPCGPTTCSIRRQ